MLNEEMIDRINKLATQFRNALDAAHRAGEFAEDPWFKSTAFPKGCCGDVCYLLEHYLLEQGIPTYHVWGEYNDENPNNYQSHAWLLTTDFSHTIDITGDQFIDNPLFLNYSHKVYVGKQDELHHMFKVEERNIRDSCRLSELRCMDESRLPRIYSTVINYIKHNIY